VTVRRTRPDWLLLFLVAAVAILFRFWHQGVVPPGFNFDEAFESLEARRLLLEPGYRPVYFTGNFGIPPIQIYLTAIAFRIFGERMLAIRYVSGVLGVLGIVALYVLARLWFPLVRMSDGGPTSPPSALVRRWIPFVACLLLAVLPWHNAFSREGVEVIQVPLWATLAILFLWLGLVSTDARPRASWLCFAVSGLFWGSAYYTYQAAWVLPGILVWFVFYKLVQERGFLRRYGLRLLLLGAVALLVLAPLAGFAFRNSEMFAHRTTQVGIFGLGTGSQSPLASLVGNILKVAGLFVFGGDINVGNNIYLRPPLPLALAAVLFLGLVVAVARFRRPEYALLVIWFLWMLSPSILSEDAPSIRRTLGSTPAMVILMAVGMGWLVDAALGWARRGATPVQRTLVPAAAGAAVLALLGYSVIWSYQYYFVEWGQSRALFNYFDVGLVKLGQYAVSSPAETRLYYTPAGEADVVHLPLTWQIRGRELRTFDGKYGLVLAPPDQAPVLYMITLFLGTPWTLPALKNYYPTGYLAKDVHDRFGKTHSVAFAVNPGTTPVLLPQNTLAANFEDQVELVGSDLSAPVVSPGDTFTISLTWRAKAGPTETGYTVFTHLLGPPKPGGGDRVWAGHDSPPLNNSYPTTRWGRGEIVIDHHTITVPPEAPAGRYEIEAGLYAPLQGGARLKRVDDTGRDLGNSVIAASLEVR